MNEVFDGVSSNYQIIKSTNYSVVGCFASRRNEPFHIRSKTITDKKFIDILEKE